MKFKNGVYVMMKDYDKFKQALMEEKEMSFISLKNDIKNIQGIIERTLEAAFESSASVVERDFKITSL